VTLQKSSLFLHAGLLNLWGECDIRFSVFKIKSKQRNSVWKLHAELPVTFWIPPAAHTCNKAAQVTDCGFTESSTRKFKTKRQFSAKQLESRHLWQQKVFNRRSISRIELNCPPWHISCIPFIRLDGFCALAKRRCSNLPRKFGLSSLFASEATCSDPGFGQSIKHRWPRLTFSTRSYGDIHAVHDLTGAVTYAGSSTNHLFGFWHPARRKTLRRWCRKWPDLTVSREQRPRSCRRLCAKKAMLPRAAFSQQSRSWRPVARWCPVASLPQYPGGLHSFPSRIR